MTRWGSVMMTSTYSIYLSGTLGRKDAKSERDEAKKACRVLDTKREELKRELTTLMTQKERLETDLARSKRQLDDLRTEKRMSE